MKPNKNTKDEGNKQKHIRIRSAGPAADCSTELKFQRPATILPNLLLQAAKVIQNIFISVLYCLLQSNNHLGLENKFASHHLPLR